VLTRGLCVALLLMTGCANVGYRDTSSRSMDNVMACKKDCLEQQKVCTITETRCQADYDKCATQCERFSGLRGTGGGAVSVTLP
jgi:hypothetical protein